MLSHHLTRIRPSLPMAWEDLDTLRFGFERAEARVRNPSAGLQRFIAALRIGIEEDQLSAAARRAGITLEEAETTMAVMKPILSSEQHVPLDRVNQHRSLRVLLCDDGREVMGLRDSLLATKLCSLDWDGSKSGDNTDSETSVELVILVERFLEPLERAQKWLLTQRPLLPIRFGDRTISVGPLIDAEGNPCHTCATLALLDRDSALPLLASQLYGQKPASETEASAHMAAAWAAVLLRRWQAGDPAAHTTQFNLSVSRGLVADEVAVTQITPHLKCACGEFSPQGQPH